MSWTFYLLAAVTLGGAVAALSLPNLMHCALSLVVAFTGLAGLYLQLNAEFAGWVQILVYVGAVSILVVFAILLTRSGEEASEGRTGSWYWGWMIAGLVGGVLTTVLSQTRLGAERDGAIPAVTVQQVGRELMGQYVLGLEVMALLLTAAMIGAVVVAMRDK